MVMTVRKVLARLAQGYAKPIRWRFHQLTKKPDRVQRKRLFAQLAREARTDFGRDHHFGSIKTLADFRRQIPIAGYDYYHPYIERVKNGHVAAMFDRQKILMFAMSSGTTDARKFIPVTERFLHDYRRGWTIWGLHMYEEHRKLWFRAMLQIASDWDEFRTPAGIPCGSISGLTAQVVLSVVRRTYLLPPASAKIKEAQTKYYLAWRLGMSRDLAWLISANPSTMVNLARFGDAHSELLLRDLYDGTINPRFTIPEAVVSGERERLLPNPQRAREIEKLIEQRGRLLPKDVWPSIGLIGTWTGGSVGVYIRHYPEYFGNPPMRDLGLIASEGRMTIPVHDGTPGGILEITSSFFEFVPVEEIDSPQPTVLESHELIEGRDYYILLTTSSGLYRYNIYDVVRCVGFHERTPVLAFLNKGSNFSNLTGEKLSEHHVAKAVDRALADQDLTLTAFTLAPCCEETTPYYGLFVEESDFGERDQQSRLAESVERNLCRVNSEYAEKRESGRIGPVRILLLPSGTWEQWDAQRLRRTGGTPEQYKHPCLVPDIDFASTMPVIQVATAP